MKLLALLAALVAGSPFALGGSDTEPPVTTITADGVEGDHGWWRSDVVAALYCVDNVQCVNTDYSLDGSDFDIYTIPFAVVGEGIHSVLGRSQDKTGNHEDPPIELVVRIDATTPSASVVEPQAGALYVNDMNADAPELPYTLIVGDKTLAADAADALSGVDRVEFFIDGALRSTATTAPYTWLWPASQERAGGHAVEVVAYDVAGNLARAGLDVITVPTTQEGLEATVAAL